MVSSNLGVVLALTALLQQSCVQALDNGLALTPPMGWRSWNCALRTLGLPLGYHGDVTQQNIRDTVDAIADQSRGFSLLDLGFSDVGVDDGWQACDAGVLVDNATTQCAPFCTSFHAADGTPLLNRSKFQDLKALVDYGHGKGTTMGWYNNNCMCGDEYAKRNNATWRQLCDEGDIKLLLSAGFDGVKIDNCGDDTGKDFAARMQILNASGKALVVENSNQGFGNVQKEPPRNGICGAKGVAPKDWPGMPCPGPGHRGNPNNTLAPGWCNYNLFRTGGDIVPDFDVVMDKLQYTTPYQDPKNPISRPGCWAYPDMLEVGNLQPLTQQGFIESRTHFGAWCVVSSPLVLGLDITNNTLLDAVWPILANRVAIGVNQAWAGHPGRLVMQGPIVNPGRDPAMGSDVWQCWAKAMPGGVQAAFVVNRSDKPITVTVPLAALGVKDGVKGKNDTGTLDEHWVIESLGPHDSTFVTLSPV